MRQHIKLEKLKLRFDVRIPENNVNKDAPDFGNPWSGGDDFSDDFDGISAFDNPWADADKPGDPQTSTMPSATADAAGEKESTGAADSAGPSDEKGSSSTGSKVTIALLSTALLVGGIWATLSNSSSKEEIEYLKDRNESLSAEADKVPGLESKIESLESDATDADSLEQQRDLLLAAFGGINPWSVSGYGTATATTWNGAPEWGIGCRYMLNDERTITVTVGTDDAEPIDKSMANNEIRGYMVSGSDGSRQVFVWAAGSVAQAEQRANSVLNSLID